MPDADIDTFYNFSVIDKKEKNYEKDSQYDLFNCIY
jgi:hypothetical protein